ncbi:unnamed protein product [Musa hybrid cultivar]
MHQQSFTVDGFFLIAVKEGVDEMIKLLANEPSVGLFFVEQHARTSMPYLLGLKVCVVFFLEKGNLWRKTFHHWNGTVYLMMVFWHIVALEVIVSMEEVVAYCSQLRKAESSWTRMVPTCCNSKMPEELMMQLHVLLHKHI